MKVVLGLFDSSFYFKEKGGHRWIAFLLMALVFLSPVLVVEKSAGQGQSGLQVIPTRIVFEGRKRSAQVNLINQGTKAATYRVSFKNMRMKEDGSYEDVKGALPDEKFAEDLIRYSPRQVVVPPGESQTVRLMLRKKRDLPAGEHRSHMLFRAIPPKNTGEDIESLAGGKGEISIQLIPIFGLTIPVIVRHGKGTATAAMGDLKINEPENPGDSSTISLSINRQGERSVFGDMIARFKPEKDGEELEVGRVNGIAVFTPNKKRIVNFNLTPPEGVELKRGNLHVVYRQGQAEGDKIFAEKQLRIP